MGKRAIPLDMAGNAEDVEGNGEAQFWFLFLDGYFNRGIFRGAQIEQVDLQSSPYC